ncbi:MAG TPA: hypothetical protein VD908_19040 [Cytophagales bacterium]|nr:hypothetical protein [Cytophagales bacterium]
MKFKCLTNLLFISLVFLLSSCFQIIEEINMNNDGSGEVNITLNMSNSKTRLASIMLLDSINGYKVPDENDIQKVLNEAVGYLQNSEGISNVKKTLDMNNFIATISFSFQNISNINHLSSQILQKQKVKYSNPSSYSFAASQGLFIRKYQPVEQGKARYLKLKEEDKSVFRQATYTSIYRFDKDIAKTLNPKAQISKSNKAIMLRCSVEDVITGKVNISNQITLK